MIDVKGDLLATIRGVTITGGVSRSGADGAAATGSPGSAGFGGDGDDGEDGGGIRNVGGLTLDHVRVLDNRTGPGGNGGKGTGGGGATGADGGDGYGGPAGIGGEGGGVFNGSTGRLTVIDSVIEGNSTGDGGNGGAAEGGDGGGASGCLGPGGNGGKAFGASGSDGGEGGGIANVGPSLDIRKTTFIANSTGHGGAGGNADGGDAGCSQSGSPASGGDASSGSGGTGGDGGAIGGGGDLDLEKSTLAGNFTGAGGSGAFGTGGMGAAGGPVGISGINPAGDAGDGGGLAGRSSSSTRTVENVTITGNATGAGGNGSGLGGDGGRGGGVWSATGSLTLDHVTIAANETGAGGEATNDGTKSPARALAVQAGNTAANNTIYLGGCSGSLVIGFNDLTDSASCPGATGDPKLGPLKDNGGATQTMALGAGSDALNKIVPSGPAGCADTDQRDVVRPIGGLCDIGAYEGAPPLATTGAPSLVRATSATVRGVVDPRGVRTSWWFEFGKTKAYGRRTAIRTLPGADPPVAAVIRWVTPKTTIHYRLVARNPDGTVRGADRTFTTPADPFPGVAVLSKQAKLGDGRKVAIRLRCPGKAVVPDACRGTLRLAIPRKGKKPLVLGREQFVLLPGVARKVAVTISKDGAELVRSEGELDAKARTIARGSPTGRQVKRTRTVALGD